MNPLQKKCVYATAGFHLLLLVILFIGPGFFSRKPPEDTLPVLKVIPVGAIEAALTTGTSANKPPPTVPQPQPQPQPEPVKPTPPTPEPPKTVVSQPAETQPVVTKPVERPVEPIHEVTKPEELPTPDDKPSDVPVPKPKPVHKTDVIDVDTSKVVVRNLTKRKQEDDTEAKEAEAEAKAERAERAAEEKRAAAIRAAAENLEHNFTSGTEVTLRGESSQATANYGQIVKSMYYNAWLLPGSAENDDASPTVRVVIARDGRVISAHIIEPSGDDSVDASVRRALDRVTFIQPFAENAKEDERTYTIKFDLKTKRML